MSEIEKLVDIINDFFGCDAAYYDVNPFDLATHLINKGFNFVRNCGCCSFYNKTTSECKVKFDESGENIVISTLGFCSDSKKCKCHQKH
jgi:hypothetical protein